MSFSIMRLLVCLLLFAIGVWSGASSARLFQSDETQPFTIPQSTQAAVQSPDPSLSPRDVVQLQVDSLGRFRDDPSAIAQCFALASPANRAITGPLNRFAAMVRSPIYRALVLKAKALLGKPVVQGEQASVLVTVMEEDRTASVFRFFLSKQTDPKWKDCWMTDGVKPYGKLGVQIPSTSATPAS